MHLLCTCDLGACRDIRYRQQQTRGDRNAYLTRWLQIWPQNDELVIVKCRALVGKGASGPDAMGFEFVLPDIPVPPSCSGVLSYLFPLLPFSFMIVWS